jgi:hypothetical protein
MFFSKPKIKGLSILLSFFITNLSVAATPIQNSSGMISTGMISTTKFVTDFERTHLQQNIKGFLERADVKKALIARGVSPAEAQNRLATLTPSELQDLNGQIVEAKAGGEILVAILLIVLIIYLIKRI